MIISNSKKKIIKSLVPPILLRFFISAWKKINKGNYRVYPEYSAEIKFQYSDFNVKDDLWNSPNWLLYESSKLNKFANKPSVHHRSVINSCRILNKVNGSKKLHVIDFGGGCGTLAQYLLNSFNNEKIELEISVIDYAKIIKLGASFF